MGEFGKQIATKIMGKKKVVVSLTEIGKNRVESQQGTGYEIRILQYLDEYGPSTFAEISRGTNYDFEKVKAVCWELKEKQCLTKAG